MRRPAAGMLFLDSFDALPPASRAPAMLPAPPEPAPRVLTDDDIAQAEAAGYRRGREDAARDDAALLARAAASIADELADAAASAAETADAAAGAMLRLLLATIGATFPALRERLGEQEVLYTIREIMPTLLDATVVRILVHPAHAAAVSAAVEQLPARRRRNASVEPCDTMLQGDARIAWRDGAAVRDTDQAWTAAQEILTTFGLYGPDGGVESKP